MKLLFLTPQLPYPPHQGTTIRNFNIIKNLAPRHQITLLSFGTEQELQDADALRALCQKVEVEPYPTRTLSQRALSTVTSPLPDMALRLESPAMRARFNSLVRAQSFDVIEIEGIEMAPFVWNSELADSANPALESSRIVFDNHNAEYALQRSAIQSDIRNPARWHGAIYSLIQWRKLVRYERGICQQADHVVACSSADARALHSLRGKSEDLDNKISVIPNGVDLEYHVPSREVSAKPNSDCAMVFSGKMDFRPNIDAMVWFCKEILPQIRAEIPQAHHVIVGQKPAPKVLALDSHNVEVTGWVPDPRPYIADSAVYVVPLRMGSGTRLKVLEAMAMGKAIVSTTRGIEGIDLVPREHILVADSTRDFARACIELLRDPARRRELGRAVRSIAEEKYDWRKLVPAFDEIYTELAKRPRVR